MLLTATEGATGLQVASFVLAAVALGTSFLLAGVRIWEAFLRRSKWSVRFDWIHHQGDPILRFTVANVGTRKYGLREIRFGTDETPKEEGWTRNRAVMERLPLLLDEGEISKAFFLETGPQWTEAFDQHLADGEITKCMVVDARDRITVHPVPRLRGAAGSS